MPFCTPLLLLGAPISSHHLQHRIPSQNGGGGSSGIEKGSLKETLLLAIPSFFDLIATILMNIGLLSVTASVYQMMRGAEMLFAAGMAVVFLKRHLNKYHYLGILCCGVSWRVGNKWGVVGARRRHCSIVAQ